MIGAQAGWRERIDAMFGDETIDQAAVAEIGRRHRWFVDIFEKAAQSVATRA